MSQTKPSLSINGKSSISSTGIITDKHMSSHKTLDPTGHPERPERIVSIINEIKNEGLFDLCKQIPSREATEEEILAVHGKKYLETMKNIPDLPDSELIRLEKYYNSIYFNRNTYLAALYSAGCVTELCDQIMQGTIANGIAIVRPPGHHAEKNEAMGFCIFNNVAVAAKSMINKYKLNRVVILDWDVHHGNATQHMFESDPRVLYISIHRYDNGKFYPGGTDGSPMRIGTDQGTGFNVNIAFNTTGTSKIGDTEYVYVYKKIIQPMLAEYNPELIIISAGFDCAHGDPLGGLSVTPSGFNYLTRELMSFAQGRVAIALEGGYNLNSISKSMVGCLRALVDPTNPMMLYTNITVTNPAKNAVLETMIAHKPYWKFLNLN
jgi:acetoin utilization deacetylase AcuC-like enzyme